MKKLFYLFAAALFMQTTNAFATQTKPVQQKNEDQITNIIQISTTTGYDWGDESLEDTADDDDEA